MLRATIKAVLAHKLRLALTTLSVMFGVAFISGTFIFTDTIDRTFNELFEDVFKGQDVIVQAETEFDVGFQGPPPIDEEVIDIVRAVPGVEAAAGNVGGFAVIYDKEGEAILPTGPPTLGGNWTEDERLLGAAQLRSGRPPERDGEVTVDARTAKDNDLAVGDRIRVQTVSGVAEYELVGIVGFGESDNLAGATFAGFDIATAQRLFELEGKYSNIVVLASEGLTPTALRDRIALSLPEGIEAITASDEAAEQSEALSDSLGFLRTALLVFAAVAVFVAGFIIQNTFRIIVRQRQRELALMRAVGATGRQVVGMVVAEALIVGVVASLFGLLLGFVIAQGLTGLMSGIGFDLPSTTAPLASRTVLIGVLVGVGVTVASAVLPAVRASRIPPVAALQDVDVRLRMSDRARLMAGGAALVIGMVAILLGLFTDVEIGPVNALLMVGIGATVVFLAVSMVSSNFVKPAVSVFGRRWVLAVLIGIVAIGLVMSGLALLALSVYMIPVALGLVAVGVATGRNAISAVRDRVTPRLAAQNSIRKPRRTATTASALMIGLALVAFFFVLGASINASVGKAIADGLRADYVVSVQGFGGGFSPELSERLDEADEIAATTSLRFGIWDRDGSEEFLMGVEAETIDQTVFLDVQQGSLEALAGGGVFVHDDVAEDEGWTLGTVIPMGFTTTGLQQVEIVGIYGESNVVQSTFLVGLDFYKENFQGFGTDTDFVVAVKAAAGVSAEASRAVVEEVAADYPNATVRDQVEYRQSQEDQVNTLLVMFNALLFLAVIIALFGITNTLALSVFERTREIGLLRAVGMSRQQVRDMIRWESIMVAVLGAVLGIVIGILFGVIITSALGSVGITTLSIPAAQIASLVVFGVVVGLAAALLPARNASRLNILEAIAYE
jgi:putative ABC transport system permease protein